MAEESIFRPYYTVLVLAFVCSALVAGAAVGLRPKQEANRQLDQKKHILRAAGLYQKGADVDQLFANIEPRVVELATGAYVAKEQIDPAGFQQVKAAMSNDQGRALGDEEDLARLRRQEKYAVVYLVQEGQKLQQVVLPVRGKGLWSTMFAYVAIDGDLSTVRGVSFYQHGETPGLGGEIENSAWQKSWQGKQVYDQTGKLQLEVVKGKAPNEGPEALSQIDGLSGATLTTKGVDNLLEFWFGDHGFKPYIEQLRSEGNNG